MVRKRDFRNEEDLEDYVHREAWSDSEDEGDLSADDSDIEPEFEFKHSSRLQQFDDDDEFEARLPENRAAAGGGNDETSNAEEVDATVSADANVEMSAFENDGEPVVVGDASRWPQYSMFENITVEKDSDVFKKPTWRKKHLQLSQEWVRFRGKCELPPEMNALQTPLGFFSLFMTDDIISHLAEQSNLYSVQQAVDVDVELSGSRPTTALDTSPDEMKRFLGINYFMSVVRYPNTRLYWSDAVFFKPIHDTMPRNRYEKIRRFLHFNDNSKQPRRQQVQLREEEQPRSKRRRQPPASSGQESTASTSTDQEPTPSKSQRLRNRLEMRNRNIATLSAIPQRDETYDRLYKIRPLIDAFNRNFKKVPMKGKLCVDEQMCATKIRHFLKQYMPDKPHPWGDKLFLLRDDSGYCYSFEIYSGDDDYRRDGEPNLGASANVVVRLARDIPRFVSHTLFFDNYYTSIPLLVYLRTQGIYGLGRIRKPRIPLCKLPDSFKKRGESAEFVASFHGIDVSTVAWNDNKIVTMASTMVGVKPYLCRDQPVPTAPPVQRFDKRTKKIETIDCPNVIHEYNKHMGGVGLMDACLGRCRNRVKSRKWTHRLFYHMCDMAMINAWILYRRHFASCSVQTNQPLKLYEFVFEVATCLTKSGVVISRTAGHPSNLESEIAFKRTRINTAPLPPSDVRLDNIGHLPEHVDSRHRCKKPGCESRTRVFCPKCNVHLCFTNEKNCFKEFHQR